MVNVSRTIDGDALEYLRRNPINNSSLIHFTVKPRAYKQSIEDSPDAHRKIHSLIGYLDSIRITRAKELLESTDLKISNIASLVGIPDSHYFSKKYRKKEGIPPSQVRKSL